MKKVYLINDSGADATFTFWGKDNCSFVASDECYILIFDFMQNGINYPQEIDLSKYNISKTATRKLKGEKIIEYLCTCLGMREVELSDSK